MATIRFQGLYVKDDLDKRFNGIRDIQGFVIVYGLHELR